MPGSYILSSFRDREHGGKSKGTSCASTETILHILLSTLRLPTEQYGCRYLTHAGLQEVTVKSRGLFYYFLSEFVVKIFSFPTKNVGELLCRWFSYERTDVQ